MENRRCSIYAMILVAIQDQKFMELLQYLLDKMNGMRRMATKHVSNIIMKETKG